MGTARCWFDGRAVLYYVEGSAKVWGLFVLLQISTFLLLAGSREAARSKSAQKKRPRAIGAFLPSGDTLLGYKEGAASRKRAVRPSKGVVSEGRFRWNIGVLAGVCRSGHGDLGRVGDGRLDARRSDVHLRLQLGILLRLLLLLDRDRGREIDRALDNGVLMDDEAGRNDVAGNLRGVA